MAGSYRFPPIGGFGNPANPWSYSDGVPVIDLQAHRNKALLLKVDVKDMTTGVTFGPYPPVGYFEGPSWGWLGTMTSLWPGATLARSSASDDVPADQWVNDALQTSVNFSRSLFTGANPLNISATTEGVIELLDPRSDLEHLFDYVWDGVGITIFRGDEREYFSTYGQVAKFTGAVLTADMQFKKIRTRDLGWKLEGLIHNEFYKGTGGLEGGEANQGKWKPYAVGYFFNAEPVPIDAANEVSQWSFAPSASVTSVTHGGVIITVSADYLNYEDLIAASIPLGQCATCKALSLVRTNFDIEFGIRVTGLGDSNVLSGHTTPEIRSECARRVATGYGVSRLSEGTEIDLASFSEVGQDHPEEVGWWWGTETTKKDALTEIMLGILGFWHVRPNGQLGIGYMSEPDPASSFVDIALGDYGMGEIEILDETLPWSGVLMGWRRNYAPQDRDQLAGSVQVDEAAAAILGAPYSIAPAVDDSVNQIYPTASPVTIMGNYLNEVDAFAQANRILGVMSVARRRYRMEMEIDAFADIINRTAHFVDFNRMKLGASSYAVCVGIDSEGFGQVSTEWWR